MRFYVYGITTFKIVLDINKIPVDNEVMYQSMIEELNNKIGDKEKKIYDLIKLSYNKV